MSPGPVALGGTTVKEEGKRVAVPPRLAMGGRRVGSGCSSGCAAGPLATSFKARHSAKTSQAVLLGLKYEMILLEAQNDHIC